MSEQGAAASYRGYRLQALYALSRILEPRGDEDLTFIPEGIEDLAIQDSELLKEIVQVKSYDGLSLSHLEPAKKGSFFRRAINYIQQEPLPIVRVVNIGLIGRELQEAWSGKQDSRDSIIKKMIGHGFSLKQIQQLFEHVELISLDETRLENQIHEQLQELLTGVDPTNAFNLLHKWLFDSSEVRAPITSSDLIEKVNSVGRFLAERAHHHKEWFTNILPIEDRSITKREEQTLQDEFFAGVSARFEHILAELDFGRTTKIEAITNGFYKSNIVIIHGASGQGKSTLAYRYINDNFSETCRYQVQIVENRQHALITAAALSGHANALQIPMMVYLDVSPRDQDWFELVAQLAKQPKLQVLVTIREEDFRRTNIPSSNEFEDIYLEFNEEEAKQIYLRASNKGFDLVHLTFDDAWDAFGEEGLLLEFVYFLTQTMTLRERLASQVQRIQNEVREKELAPDELLLLRLVAVITAYEGRLYIPSLVDSLDIPEPALTLHKYEKEYLIRVSPDRVFIESLHPIRSQILSDLLTDPAVNPWIKIAEIGLPHTSEEDWETFVLHALINRPDQVEAILALAKMLSPSSWNGLVGLIRCFLWIGVKKYLDTNQHILKEARELMGPAWFFIPDLNFAGEVAPNSEGWWNNLGNLITEEIRARIEEIRDRQTPKDEVFQLAGAWLLDHDSYPDLPESSKDWSAAAETLYWASRFGCPGKVAEWITDDSLYSAFKKLTLSEFSDILLALFICNPDRYAKWVDVYIDELKIRLAEDYRIILLEDKDEARIIHFLSYPEERLISDDASVDEETAIHEVTMERIQVVRQLFPGFEKYGSQGYGHQIPGLEVISDDTKKSGVPKLLLPPKWPIRINGIATGLLQNQLRPESWEEYLQSIIEIRGQVIGMLNGLTRNVVRFFQRERPFNYLDEPPVSTGEWDQVQTQLGDLPSLPKVCVDPWGFGQPEGGKTDDEQVPNLVPNSILHQVYKPYLEAERGYFSNLQSFFQQAIHVSVINIRAGKLPEDSPQQKAILTELESKGIVLNNRFLSSINLWESFTNIEDYQKQFRKLFGQRVDIQQLTDLEKQEIDTLTNLLLCWIIFTNHPRTSYGDVNSQIPLRFRQRYQKLLKEIEKTLDAVENDSTKAQIIETKLKWEGVSSIWIQLDVETPLNTYVKLEELIVSLKEPIGLIKYGDPDYFLIEMNCKQVVIVPTVKGKLVEEKVWPLQTFITLAQDHKIEEKPYLYIPHEVSSDMYQELGFAVWEIRDRDNITKFETSFSEFIVRVTLLGKMADLPEIPEELLPTVESYMQDRSKEISNTLQTYLDSASVFFDLYNSLPDEEKAMRQDLNEAIQGLIHIRENILPEDGVLNLPLNEMHAYAETLQETIPTIQGIKMIWLGEAIRQNSNPLSMCIP